LEAESEISGAIPVPVTDTVCDTAGSVTWMLNDDVFCPCAIGENVMATLQDAPAAKVEEQVGTAVNGAPILKPAKLNAASPVFVIVTVWAALVVPINWVPNPILEGDTESTGATPFPVTGRVCDASGDATITLRFADAVPRVVGKNETLIEQLAPAVTVDPQLLVCVNGAVTVTELICSAASPVFDNVIV